VKLFADGALGSRGAALLARAPHIMMRRNDRMCA